MCVHWSLSYVAIAGLFFVVGLGGGSWGSRVVALPEALALSNQMLGFVLLMSVLGALIAFASSSWVLKQGKQARLTLAAVVIYGASLPLAGATFNAWTTALSLLVMGLSSGFLTISMNLYALAFEKRHERSVLGNCYGLLSAGTLVGALSGQRADAMHIGLAPHLSGVAGCIGLFGLAVLSHQLWQLDAKPDPSNASSDATKSDKAPAGKSQSLMVVGIMVACAAMSEATINTWAPLLLHQEYELSTATAAYGFVVATLVTVLTRLGVEAAVRRMGPRQVVLTGCGFVVAGASLLAASRSAPLALVGIALSAIGVASVVPIGYREGSQRRPQATQKALAILTQWTYVGALLAPPVTGFISKHSSLRTALACLGGLAVVVAWSSKSLGAQKTTPA